MRRDQRQLAAVAIAAAVATVLLTLWLAATVALAALAMSAEQRQDIFAALSPYLPPAVLTILLLIAAVAFIVQLCYRHWVTPAARLLEQARPLLSADVQRKLVGAGSAEIRGLAQTINDFAQQRNELRRDVEGRVAAASRDVARERNRLAALMNELTQSVVVCNIDGRVLLYNNRARRQFRAISPTPTLADGAELIGLGRSIYTVFDHKLVAHALESVQHRLQRGDADASVEFVTVTAGGRLLRAQLAPVVGAAGDSQAAETAAQLDGFVLMLDDITSTFEQESERDRLLHGLTEASRGSLANLQAAVEILDDADLDEATRERFLCVIRAESSAMSRRIQDFAAQATRGLATRWPLEEMLGADLLVAAQRRIETQLGMRVRADDVDTSLWLHLDSFSLLQALAYLAERLRDEHDLRDVRLRLAGADAGHAHLDLVWVGLAMSTETLMTWEMDPMRSGDETSPLTVREVVQRHGGEFWFERERVRHQAFFRFLLPLASGRRAADAATFLRSDSRPEVYDFDLFRVGETTSTLDESRLVELAYTVFDTETTGLNPSAGDEIIQIGAVRLVNCRLLRTESFEQLIDPRRPIPASTIPIHGIAPEMIVGRPTIDAVLPAFYAFAQDTVLVAHNAAFDLRFLQMKEQASGVRFRQPVLDTLLLSALVHPNQESHTLEAIAERFDVPVIGRHTALGDAIVTAEVFLKLIPLLAEKGIDTLAQAREASQRTYFARFKY